MEKVKYLSRESKFKSNWESTKLSFERDLACGFSWPQKNYRCSFCKKEFRSAQALGGHMNVHRRDRAKLRQSPSWDFPNPNPNPNPNFTTSLSFVPRHTSTYTHHHHTSLTPASLVSFASPPSNHPPKDRAPLNISKNMGAFLEVQGFKGFNHQENDQSTRVSMKTDVDMGRFLQESKEDLDLELRLGYNSYMK